MWPFLKSFLNWLHYHFCFMRFVFSHEAPNLNSWPGMELKPALKMKSKLFTSREAPVFIISLLLSWYWRRESLALWPSDLPVWITEPLIWLETTTLNTARDTISKLLSAFSFHGRQDGRSGRAVQPPRRGRRRSGALWALRVTTSVRKVKQKRQSSLPPEWPERPQGTGLVAEGVRAMISSQPR